MPVSGECFCGSVKYKIEGTLKDARSCHCSRCRKAFSSQASSYALVKPEEFKWLRGEELLSSHESQPGFGLQFCGKCGSTLCGTYKGSIHGVTLGCLNGSPDVEVGYHIFVDSKATWEIIPKGVKTYSEGAP